jgi:hypothetical protein
MARRASLKLGATAAVASEPIWADYKMDLIRLLPWLSLEAGEVLSAGLAEFDQQGLHPSLAEKISHFMKGAIWRQVGLQDSLVDAHGGVDHRS